MNTSDFDLSLFLRAFSGIGAIITEGNGELFVDGKETDVITALRKGFCDTEVKPTVPYKQNMETVTVEYGLSSADNNWANEDQTIAA